MNLNTEERLCVCCDCVCVFVCLCVRQDSFWFFGYVFVFASIYLPHSYFLYVYIEQKNTSHISQHLTTGHQYW